MTMDYSARHVYSNSVLERESDLYGYWADSALHYNLTDYQGNVRLVVDGDKRVVESNHYYPYGGLMGMPAVEQVQPFKYSGKELDREAGLDLLDFAARYHDPLLSRFTTQDFLAENLPILMDAQKPFRKHP